MYGYIDLLIHALSLSLFFSLALSPFLSFGYLVQDWFAGFGLICFTSFFTIWWITKFYIIWRSCMFILGFGVKQIARRRAAHLQKYPDAKVISLGIGDTTEPIPEVITSAMAKVWLYFTVVSIVLLLLEKECAFIALNESFFTSSCET